MPKRIFLIAVVLLLATGCAGKQVRTPSPDDPWEGFNRAMFTFNDKLDRAILKPIAKQYQKTPKPFRKGVTNFTSNISMPLDIANSFLQGKFKKGFTNTGRFVMNTTVGLGGAFDPASRVGLRRHEEDFGQTLAHWGVPSGPYLVLPIFGPSTLRDGFAQLVDRQFDPLVQYNNDDAAVNQTRLLQLLALRASFLEAESAIGDQYDPYSFIRDAWLQNRNFRVHDGNPPVEDEFDDSIFDDVYLDDLEDPPASDDEPTSDQ